MIVQLDHSLRVLGAYGIMIGDVARDIGKNGLDFKEVTRQIMRIGVESIPIVLLTAIFNGMVLALQTAYGLERFGAKNYVGNVVGLATIRELGPVMTAIVICGRVGAGFAAEIGSMVVTEQVDAIRALGASPITKLVSPRVIAGCIALPCLVVFATATGIYGGLLVAVYELKITAYTYYRSLLYTIVIHDVFDGLVKSAIFGFLFVTVACFLGLRTRGGTEGVGKTTTLTVVIGIIVILVSDFFITKALILLS